MPVGTVVRTTADVPVDPIRPNQFSPRKTFNDEQSEDPRCVSQELGVLQPISVRPVRANRNKNLLLVSVAGVPGVAKLELVRFSCKIDVNDRLSLDRRW